MARILFYNLFAFIIFPNAVYLTYYPTVFWTSNNCRFKLNRPNGKNYSIKVTAMSKMIFMCPHSAIWADKSTESVQTSMMYENVWLVDKQTYESCSIKNKTQFKEILKCDKITMKSDIKYSEQYFSPDQAYRGKACYDMGKDYYFISTSKGPLESLNNTEGGHCKTHHMKLHIYVCKENEPCDFEMPECPKDGKKKQENDKNDTSSQNCSDTTKVSAQTGLSGWFEDNRHPVLYAVMGLIIVILLVTIIWLLYVNWKYKKSGMISENRKLSIEKELVNC